jgi:hypothetical protein
MPKMITCPSGLAGEIRSLKVKELNLMAERGRAADLIQRVVASCWTSTSEPGPYKVEGGAAPDWKTVLTGDLTYIFIQIRMLTHGPNYMFRHQCEDARCRNRFEWQIDLGQLEIRRFTPEQAKAFAGGNEFVTAFPDGRQVTFRLPVGLDQDRADKLRRAKRDKAMTIALAVRIAKIDGVEERDKFKFLDDLEVSDANAIVNSMDEVDCGVETGIEIRCPECEAIQDVDLPFDRGFLFPSDKGKRTEETTTT